jgi:hypothetical protein
MIAGSNKRSTEHGATLFRYQHGDVARGDWDWAVGSENRLGAYRPPNCVAVTNFHGCMAAGHDPEALAALFAASPRLLEALEGAIGALEFSRDYHADLSDAEQAFCQAKLDAARAAIAAAK